MFCFASPPSFPFCPATKDAVCETSGPGVSFLSYSLPIFPLSIFSSSILSFVVLLLLALLFFLFFLLFSRSCKAITSISPLLASSSCHRHYSSKPDTKLNKFSQQITSTKSQGGSQAMRKHLLIPLKETPNLIYLIFFRKSTPLDSAEKTYPRPKLGSLLCGMKGTRATCTSTILRPRSRREWSRQGLLGTGSTLLESAMGSPWARMA